VGHEYGGFRGSVGMGILWGFLQVFVGMDGMGIEIQSHGSRGLLMSIPIKPLYACSSYMQF